MRKDIRNSIILWLASIALVCTYAFDLQPDFGFLPDHDAAPWLVPVSWAVMTVTLTVDLVVGLRRKRQKDRERN